ncbi:unnamed protein product [Clonostachys rosea]|uniref:Laccase n=1 Tax=Bionectria ochroleuca TaxID=29856 RepID=A0ABY6TT85_BIOOC|nr:unnamed protein product [Clonostachys rosea]
MGNFASRPGSLALRADPFDAGDLGLSTAQVDPNGESLLGTLDAPELPEWLTNNPLPNGFPWSTLDTSTNYYTTSPNTGVIRRYDFTISRGFKAPDGYKRDVLLINGAFPGPLIEANWGDTIEVTVHNKIFSPDEGFALHWHGFLMKDSPWEDGAPAVTQCPIPPGKSFTYQFKAELYGTTWYHSHYSSQYAGGLSGPIVIHGPNHERYDIDLGPVMLSDWYHKEYFDLVEEVMAPNSTPPYADNNLINGKMNFDCSTVTPGDKTPCKSNAGISKFKFRRNKTHRLRLINSGAEGLQRFSIDGHKMKVIANDFVPVEPYETDVVTLGIGQRADVLVKADGKLDSYWMRSNVSTICGLNNAPNALAAIFYDNADTRKKPKSQAWDRPDPGTCANDDLALVKPKMKLPLPKADISRDMTVELTKNGSDITLWEFDGIAYRGNYNSPTLLMSILGNYTFDEEWNVVNTANANSVRINVINNTPLAHPMHMHGYNMYILHEGPGAWDGTIVRPENPQRRDTYQVQAFGHLVIQFDAGDNPGVWPFHCHIAWHVSAGFFVQFLTKPDQVKKRKIPNVVAETCRQWGDWTKTNIPAQIDSGL